MNAALPLALLAHGLAISGVWVCPGQTVTGVQLSDGMLVLNCAIEANPRRFCGEKPERFRSNRCKEAPLGPVLIFGSSFNLTRCVADKTERIHGHGRGDSWPMSVVQTQPEKN